MSGRAEQTGPEIVLPLKDLEGKLELLTNITIRWAQQKWDEWLRMEINVLDIPRSVNIHLPKSTKEQSGGDDKAACEGSVLCTKSSFQDLCSRLLGH